MGHWGPSSFEKRINDTQGSVDFLRNAVIKIALKLQITNPYTQHSTKRTLASTLMCSTCIWILNQAINQKTCILLCMEGYDHYFHLHTREPFSQSIFPRAECMSGCHSESHNDTHLMSLRAE